MSACPVHRHRLRRLWRLPTPREVGAVAGVTAVAAAASALVGPLWTPVAVVVGATVLTIVHLRRNRDRIALEWRLIRALLDAGGDCRGAVGIPGLDAEVRVETGGDGVARITATSWLDAIRALGYAMGRDRGFQLDLLRRTAQGRLAEVWGRTALASDQRYRPLGLARAATNAELAPPEHDLLAAFADGVNEALDHPPVECRFLSYRPAPWTVTDSVLIALFLFHGLSWNEPAKRAETVLRQAFPPDVADFLLTGDPAVPPDLARWRTEDAVEDLVAVDRVVAGSNCWVADGPILACDPHLSLAVPNLLYEVDLRWGQDRLRGLVAPGLPVVLTGGNGHLVWGVTNLTADVLDLVPCAEAELTTDTESIRVRGGRDVPVEIRRHGDAPVSPTPLLGRPVACRWTGHDPRAADLRFQRLAHATDVAAAVAVLDDAEGIALNVLVADAAGRRAHLATGLLPGLEPAQRPRVVDPPERILVSANDAALPGIGYDLDPGHRASRIREVLTSARHADPAAMRALQHDTVVDLYRPYQELAERLADWDGRSEVDSRAFPVLVRLRQLLAERVLGPYLSACRDLEPGFVYPFQAVDRPVLAILHAQDPALLGGEEPRALVARCVDQAVADVAGARWGALNTVGLNHPLTALAPWAAPLLDIPARPQPGALHAVRACVPGFGPVGRAVLTPGGVAEFELPAGQSGHPLSPHYADRHREWAGGGRTRRPRRPRRHRCASALVPASTGTPRTGAQPATTGRSR
jgi:penicillin G amidase